MQQPKCKILFVRMLQAVVTSGRKTYAGLANHKTLVFMVALVPAAAWIAAITADDNPAMSIFAGVLVGAVVTAVATWVIGPEVERQVRRQTERDTALAEMVQDLFGLHRLTFELTSDIFVRNAAVLATLNEVSELADNVSLLALKTREPRLIEACAAWGSLCWKASLSVRALPQEEADGTDGLEGTVPMTLILGGILGSVEDLDPLEKEAYNLCERVNSEGRELLRQVLVLSDMEVPAFLHPVKKSGHIQRSIAEDRLMTDVVQELFRSYAADSAAAEVVGSALLDSSRQRAELRQELSQLEARLLTEISEEDRPRAIGEAVLRTIACDSDESRKTYPLLAIEAMCLILGRRPEDSRAG